MAPASAALFILKRNRDSGSMRKLDVFTQQDRKRRFCGYRSECVLGCQSVSVPNVVLAFSTFSSLVLILAVA